MGKVSEDKSSETDKQIMALQAQISAQQAEQKRRHDLLASQLQTLLTVTTQLQEQAKQYQAENTDLRGQVALLSSQLTQERRERGGLAAQLQLTTAQLASAQERIGAQEARVGQQAAQVAEYRKCLRAVQSLTASLGGGADGAE